MIDSNIFFLGAYAIIYGSISIVGIGYLWKNKKSSKFNLQNLTVIIPFRNEEKSIELLLESINNQAVLPKEFIFVDDHSEDFSIDRIKQGIKISNYQILELKSELIGKKRAIRKGMENANSTHILTLDSDVSFAENYFEELSINIDSESSMTIFPVKFEGNTTLHFFSNWDNILAYSVNCITSGISRPIMASGANLVFRKDDFLKFSNTDHLDIPSGDDQFLLRDFVRNGLKIDYNPTKSFVSTLSPTSLKETVNQRARWIGKSRKINDQLASLFFWLQLVFLILLNIILIGNAVTGNWSNFGLVLVIKMGLDILLTFPFVYKLKSYKSIMVYPIYQMVLPIYSLVIFISSLISVEWKGRAKKNSDNAGV